MTAQRTTRANYILSADSAWCLDALSGEKIWSYKESPGEFFEGNPPVADGVAYFIMCDNFTAKWSQVTALEAETGEVLWTREFPYFATGCATYHQGIYTPFYLGPLTCIDCETGETVWQSFEVYGGYWDSSPVIYDGDLYIGGMDGYLHAFSIDDGSLIWEYKVHPNSGAFPAGVEPTPALHDNVLFTGCSSYGSAYGLVAAYQASNGLPIWEIIDQIELHGSIALADGLAFLAEHKNNMIYALDWEDGSVVWDFTVPSCTSLQTTPAICDGMVYFGTTNDTLYAFGTGLKYTYMDDFQAAVGANELIVNSWNEGSVVAADTINFTVTQAGISLEPSLQLNLSASPNPTYSNTSISFALEESGFTSLRVFDLTGRVVSTLVNQQMGQGNHTVQWNGNSENGTPVSSGLYLCRIEYGGLVETTGLCVLKTGRY